MTASAVEPHGETLHCPDAWEGHRQGLGRAAWAGVAESHGRGGGAGGGCVCASSRHCHPAGRPLSQLPCFFPPRLPGPPVQTGVLERGSLPNAARLLVGTGAAQM